METSTTASRTVLYAGRWADRVTTSNLPKGCEVLTDWDVLPSQLALALEGADTLVVSDPFSFPFEAMTWEQWDVPLVVVLPSGFDAAFLEAVFGAPVFERLGFFDRVATADTALWEKLRARYGWPGMKRVGISGVISEEAAVEVCAALAAENSTPVHPPERYEAIPYWREVGGALAEAAPLRTVQVSPRGVALDKATDRAQAAAFLPQIAAARGGRTEDTPFRVLEVGAGLGRWASRFDPATTDYGGVDVSGNLVDAARAAYPDHRFDAIGEDLTLPYPDESFDLVFTVSVLCHNPPSARLKLISEMWRVARPGTRLMFLEDFVAEEGSSTIYRMPILGFAQAVLEATASQVVLEYVESVRYPGDPFVRGGLLALTRLGVPKTW